MKSLNSRSRIPNHHIGDDCLGGHFAEAELKECVAWLENRPEHWQWSNRLDLRSLLTLMRGAGWLYTDRRSFDAAQGLWVSAASFSSGDSLFGWESSVDDLSLLELETYRNACIALASTRTSVTELAVEPPIRKTNVRSARRPRPTAVASSIRNED
ncbi:MAG: hypothetical protein O3B84_04075 [Chloroflexi bacterium]|nr:hypothetical protein [Chloroflexota bacterium]